MEGDLGSIGNDMALSLEDELMADLTAELSVSDATYNESLMLPKVRNAIREVKRARKYPSYYTDEQVDEDMYDFYSNIRNIALYDYNLVGGEGQSSSSENGVSRSYIDRNSLFNGIIPLARC